MEHVVSDDDESQELLIVFSRWSALLNRRSCSLASHVDESLVPTSGSVAHRPTY